jgi:hypothetical protein
MDIKKVTRKIRLDSMHTAIKYQLITELVFLRKQNIIDSDLEYLTLLGEWGSMSLKQFCHNAVLYLFGEDSANDGIKHPVRVQTVRNRLSILEKRGFIVKNGRGNKTISINPHIPLSTDPNLLLEYNFLYIEATESKKLNSRVEPEIATL